jgi:zinc transporter 2
MSASYLLNPINSLLQVTSILVWEAVQRVLHPEPVNGKVMTIIAVGGVAVNLALFAILGGHGHAHGHSHSHSHGHTHGHARSVKVGLAAVDEGRGDEHDGGSSHGSDDHHHGHDHGNGHHMHADEANLNVRGAVIHVIGDLIQSIGVAIAGALIWVNQDGDPRWALADPACTFLFAILVLWTTAGVLRDVADVLMERAPRGHDVGDIWEALTNLEGVEEVHDLHVWSLTPGIPLLAAHVAVAPEADAAEVLRVVSRFCRGELGIEHTTVQLMVANGGRCTCGAVPPSSANSSRLSLGGV